MHCRRSNEDSKYASRCTASHKGIVDLKFYQHFKCGQSKPAPRNAPPWMDGKWTGQFFSWDSCSPANLPIAQGSKSVPGILKLVFIQLDGLKEGVVCLWVLGGHNSAYYPPTPSFFFPGGKLVQHPHWYCAKNCKIHLNSFQIL